MLNLEERLKELDIGNESNKDADIKRIVAKAVHEVLKERPIITSLSVSKALRELSQKYVIKSTIASRAEEFSSPMNPLICTNGVFSAQLRNAIINILGEIPGFKIKIHFGSLQGNGGTIYYKDEAKLRDYIKDRLKDRPLATLHYDFKLED